MYQIETINIKITVNFLKRRRWLIFKRLSLWMINTINAWREFIKKVWKLGGYGEKLYKIHK